MKLVNQGEVVFINVSITALGVEFYENYSIIQKFVKV